MVREHVSDPVRVEAGDLRAFADLSAIAGHAEAGDVVEYWKSSPYVLSFMDEYDLKRKAVRALEREEAASHARGSPALLRRRAVDRYDAIEPANGRMRHVSDLALGNNAWQWLWLPPSMPYYVGTGPYAGEQGHAYTKQLVFSSWKVVPKSIAMLVSYEAERRVVALSKADITYRKLHELAAPLHFGGGQDDDRVTGMSTFALLYPSPTLAKEIDPLAIAATIARGGTLPTADAVVASASAIVSRLLRPLVAKAPTTGQKDKSWYWAAALLLDGGRSDASRRWIGGEAPAVEEPDWGWRDMAGSRDAGFRERIEELRRVLEGDASPLGRPPEDLAEVVARIALGSPAIVTLRALRRRWPEKDSELSLLAAASWAALGFRSLLNRPETTLLLNALDARSSSDAPYWRKAIDYAVGGNLQAVMDEYAHVLYGMLGLAEAGADGALEVSKEVARAVSIRAAGLEYDHFEANGRGGLTSAEQRPRVRCRFALRYGAGGDRAEDVGDGDARTRDDAVRAAFNSPFRPFVLASTSVGQEGLDFHPYCHSIVHWNLPSNPVDLEQREGRIHRFKSHFVRKNLVVQRAGELPLRGGDPWEQVFADAKRTPGASEIVPFWVAEGPYGIERRVPAYPLSRDAGDYQRLKRSLALYRVVFGQPRQQELLELIDRRVEEGVAVTSIDLSPGAGS